MVEAQEEQCATLNSGQKMPLVGLGIWKIPNEVCADMVYNAIEAGYRLVDSASDYGNEKEAGEGLKRVFDSGMVKREELFIVSKLWQTDHHPDHVEAACRKTMADLQVDYLDLYLIHFPMALKHVPNDVRYPPGWFYNPGDKNLTFDTTCTYQQTYEAMEKLVEKGLVKNIGCSNMGPCMLREVMIYSKIKPAVHQMELHPYNTFPQLVKYCKENNIHMQAYSAFGALSFVVFGADPKLNCLENETIKAIGAKHGKSAAQVCLRFGVQRGHTVIPKTSRKERLAENKDLFSWSLTEEDMTALLALNINKHFNDPGEGFNAPIFDVGAPANF